MRENGKKGKEKKKKDHLPQEEKEREVKEDAYRMLVRGSLKSNLKSSLFCPNGEIENERCKEKATRPRRTESLSNYSAQNCYLQMEKLK